MSRPIKISAGVLNVRIHPHSPERYASFIEDLFDLREAVRLRGDRYGMLSLIDRKERRDGFITGIITTFINIEFEGRWFDTSDMKDATEEQVSRVSIPENLHPNAASFYFEFDTVDHKLYFQTYSEGKVLTVNQAHALFEGLADDPKIFAKYGPVQITVVQSKSGLDALFNLPVIKEIKITIYKPNPDIFADDFEEQIEAHLAQANSQRVTVAYEAEPGKSVNPTDEIRQISEVALENGEVEVRGRDAKGAVTKSTEQQPKIIHDKFDPEEISESEAFRRLVPRRRP